jgi:hypothetical protein
MISGRGQTAALKAATLGIRPGSPQSGCGASTKITECDRLMRWFSIRRSGPCWTFDSYPASQRHLAQCGRENILISIARRLVDYRRLLEKLATESPCCCQASAIDIRFNLPYRSEG